ncbi:MAG: hypothetical protein AAF721_07065 [Myxococcota bacterium]
MLTVLMALSLGFGPAAAATPPGEAEAAAKAEATSTRHRAENLALVGAGVFASAYGITTLVAAGRMDRADSQAEFASYTPLVIPVVGPIVGIARTPRARLRFGFAMSTLTQGLGLGLMVSGAAVSIGQARRGIPKPPRKTKTLAMMGIVGGATAGLMTYLASLSIGAASQKDDPVGGRRLAIPLVGGFASMPTAGDYVGQWGRGISSVVQIASLSVVVAGAVRIRQKKREAQRVAVSVAPATRGAQVFVRGRF